MGQYNVGPKGTGALRSGLDDWLRGRSYGVVTRSGLGRWLCGRSSSVMIVIEVGRIETGKAENAWVVAIKMKAEIGVSFGGPKLSIPVSSKGSVR